MSNCDKDSVKYSNALQLYDEQFLYFEYEQHTDKNNLTLPRWTSDNPSCSINEIIGMSSDNVSDPVAKVNWLAFSYVKNEFTVDVSMSRFIRFHFYITNEYGGVGYSPLITVYIKPKLH